MLVEFVTRSIFCFVLIIPTGRRIVFVKRFAEEKLSGANSRIFSSWAVAINLHTVNGRCLQKTEETTVQWPPSNSTTRKKRKIRQSRRTEDIKFSNEMYTQSLNSILRCASHWYPKYDLQRYRSNDSNAWRRMKWCAIKSRHETKRRSADDH